MIHSLTVTLGAKYLTGMVTSVPPYETFSLIKNNILHQSKIYKNHFENSTFWGIWPLGHVGHVPYSFINMFCISKGIFDDKLRLQSLSVGTTANAALSEETKHVTECKTSYIYIWWVRDLTVTIVALLQTTFEAQISYFLWNASHKKVK